MTEEPGTEEQVTEEPGTEELVTEELVTEEPGTEELVTEEPGTEELEAAAGGEKSGWYETDQQNNQRHSNTNTTGCGTYMNAWYLVYTQSINKTDLNTFSGT